MQSISLRASRLLCGFRGRPAFILAAILSVPVLPRSAPAPGAAPDTARIYAAGNYAWPHAPGELIVAFRPGKAGLSVPTPQSRGLRVVKEISKARRPGVAPQASPRRRAFLYEIGSLATGLAAGGPDSLYALAAALRRDPNVAYAEPNYVRSLQGVSADSLFKDQWGLHNTGRGGGGERIDADIDAPEAWDWQAGDRSLVAGVIDDGIDYTHPDLASNIWTNAAEAAGRPGVDDDGNGYADDVHGYDFINNDADPMPDGGQHGTHVAGILAAAGDNGFGVAGVAWKASVAALRIFLPDGYTTDAEITEAIRYANAMGMRLTNNSYGGGPYSQSTYDAIAAGASEGYLFVTGAGNNGVDNDLVPFYPASYGLDNIIAVAATNRFDRKASWSDFGAGSVHLGAPGVDIMSTIPGNAYDQKSGTSMAAPLVAGAAYLAWCYRASLTAAEVKGLLLRSIDTLPDLYGTTISGGRLNLAKLAAALAPPALSLDARGFSVRLAQGAAAERILTLANPGLSNLFYGLSIVPDAPWLAAAPAGSPPDSAPWPGPPFFEGFESGFGKWTRGGGRYTRSVTNAVAVSGKFSFTQIGGSPVPYDGVKASFAVGTRPRTVSFSVRSATAAASAGYVTLEGFGGIPIDFHLGKNGRIEVNGIQRRGYVAGRWYALRFAIDWPGQTFDYFLDDTLVAQSVPFQTPAQSLLGLLLYNVDSAQAWYDDIRVDTAGSPPLAGTVAAGGTAALRLAFDAGGLSAGRYLTDLILGHNVPGASHPVAVPCTLFVGGNGPPVLQAGPGRSVHEAETLAFAVSASDPDGDSVTLSASGLPPGAAFEPATGAFRWTPSYSQAGVDTVRFIAAAAGAADTGTVVITVLNVDRPPVLDSIGPRAFREGSASGFTLGGRDPDGDPVVFSAPSLPAGATLAGPVFNWSPGYADAGTRSVLFIAAAGSLADSEWVAITVADVDRPPALAPVPPGSVRENQRLAFPVTATDPDGNPVSLTLENAPPGAVLGSGGFSWIPGYTQAGSYRLRFIAAARGLADTLEVEVEVEDAGTGLGTLRLTGERRGTRFFLMPAGDHEGSYLGTDSVELSLPSGGHRFQASRPGCRPQRFSAAVLADSVRALRISLRPEVPMLLASPETVIVDGRPYAPPDSALPALADLDRDGREDLVVVSPGGPEFFAGLDADSSDGARFRSSRSIGFSPQVRAGLVSAAFADWDGDGTLDLIGCDTAGRVFLSRLADSAYDGKDVLVIRSGERCHPFLRDYDGDGRADLGVFSRGAGLFFYRNEGPHGSPVLDAPWELVDEDGAGLRDLEGPPAWSGLADGPEPGFLAAEGGRMRRIGTAPAAGRLAIGKRDEVNLSGSAFACPGCGYAGRIAAANRPGLLVFAPGRPALAYAGRLAGDFNRDGRVDIRDYSRLADAWEAQAGDADWDPALNLRLDAGAQRIDVKDLGWFSDLWELEE